MQIPLIVNLEIPLRVICSSTPLVIPFCSISQLLSSPIIRSMRFANIHTTFTLYILMLKYNVRFFTIKFDSIFYFRKYYFRVVLKYYCIMIQTIY